MKTVAFTEGKRLDEIEQARESGKRPYQRILLVIGSAAITFIVCLITLLSENITLLVIGEDKALQKCFHI